MTRELGRIRACALLLLAALTPGCSVITMTRQTPPRPMGREITANERALLRLKTEDDEYKLCDQHGACAAISCSSFREVQDCRYFGPHELLDGYVKALGSSNSTAGYTLSDGKGGGRLPGGS